MTVDLRELRLSLKGKLDERRSLLTENARLRQNVRDAEFERDIAKRLMKSRAVNFVLDHCADEIINEVLRMAMEASEVVADQTDQTGDYVVGINLPSLHIRHRIARLDLDVLQYDAGPLGPAEAKHIDFRLKSAWR